MKFLTARWLWILLAVILPAAGGLWVELPSSGEKCLSESLHSKVVVLGYYYAFFGDVTMGNETELSTISAKVVSPYGNTLHHQENVTHGEFAFATMEAGNYEACFTVHGDHPPGKTVTVGVEWKTGIAAEDWDSVAKKEKIEGLELELRKLESSVEAIRDKLVSLVNRELEMRETSEKTNARVAWYSISSLSICIVVSLVQLWYLKRYFQKKKLI